MPRPRVSAKQREVDDWNKTVPIGTPVLYWPGSRQDPPRTSRTRTAASLLQGHTPVVWVAGYAGCIALSHCEPRTEAGK